LAIEGAGHLASALIEGFHRAQAGPVSIHNRTTERAMALAGIFPGLRVFERDETFDLERCPLLLVVPGPAILQLPPERMERLRRSGRIVVSCAGGLPLSLLEERFPGIPWVKSIPSVAAAVGRSVTLIASRVNTGDDGLREIQQLFRSVGSVIQFQTDEEVDRLSAITSCLPGMLAAILDEFARTYGLDENQTRELLIESSLGSILVAKGKALPLPDMVARVANPGGLTEVGVSIIRRNLPPILSELKMAMEDRIQRRRQGYLDAGRRE
jgi:pyrroline-5-carboxylate reductase